ncbi:unnamed protein product [Boreogadus saida]
MENCSFQTELVSIMEILAKAAVAEINRRVDDSCAVFRLEISQSQSDIYVLKKKCDVMEAELKRSRIRAKKKGFSPSVHAICSPMAKDVLNKEADTVSWGRESTIEQIQALQRGDLGSANEMDDVLPIKEEGTEEDTWNHGNQGQSFDTSSVTEICSPRVKDVSHKEVDLVSWGRESTLEQMQALQRGDLESGSEMDVLPIKEEGTEDDTWNSGHQGPSSRPLTPDVFPEHYPSESPPLLSDPTAPEPFPRQTAPQLLHDRTHAAMKREEPDRAAAAAAACALGSGGAFLPEDDEEEEAEPRRWAPADRSSDDGGGGGSSGDPGFLFGGAARPEYEPSPSLFKNGLPAVRYVGVDLGSPGHHAAGKLHLASRLTAARARRRARNLSYKRLQQQQQQAHGEAHHSGSSHHPPAQQQQQHQQQQQQQQQHQQQQQLQLQQQQQYMAAAAAADMSDASQGPSGAGNPLGFSRANVALAKARMRAMAWRSGSVGDKRFCCTYCDKSFVRFCQLEEHLRRHTGERPFSCLQCGRSFTKQCNLIRHAVVHSGEKPHQCAACGKCFTQRSSLKSHQKTAH